jgi:hypothetical protein
MYQGVIPATVLVNADNVIQDYDYLGRETRAHTITHFFDIIFGQIDSEVFNFPTEESVIFWSDWWVAR